MIEVEAAFLSRAREYRERGWWRDRTLLADFIGNVGRDPGKVAIISVSTDREAEVRLTYTQLHERVMAVARLLKSSGVKRGDVVALQLPNGWEFTAIVLACYVIGAVVCPIIPILRAREAGFIMSLTGAKLIITARRFRRFDYLSMYCQLQQELSTPFRIMAIEEWELSSSEPVAIEPDISADEVAEILFTSGTTGEPKGVLHTHNTQYARTRAFHEPLGLKRDDVVLMSSTMSHSSGFLYGLCVPTALGMTAVYLDIHDPERMLDLMERENVTWSMGSTTFLVDAISAQTRCKRVLEKLRMFASGGAPIPPEIVKKARDVLGTRVIAIWGMTENGGVTATPISEPFDAAAESDGLPVPWMEVKVVDEQGAPLPTGTTGHLKVRGASQTPGYLGRPDAYRACLDAEGWFDTGDLAYLNSCGFVRINGRAKDVIIRGGENIPVVEVEAAIYQMHGVKEVTIVAYPDARLGERACAVVVLEDGAASIGLDDISAHLARLEMSKTYFPERLLILNQLPKTMTGKIQKFALREIMKNPG